MSHTLGNVVNGVGRGIALSQTFLLLNLLQNTRGKSFCVAWLEVREVLNTTPGKASQRGSVGSLNFSDAETLSVHTVAITGATLGAYARKLWQHVFCSVCILIPMSRRAHRVSVSYLREDRSILRVESHGKGWG